MTQVTVVQHTPAGGPGRLAAWLAEDGLTLDVVRAFDGEEVPVSPPYGTGRAGRTGGADGGGRTGGADVPGQAGGPGGAGLIVLGGGYMPDADGRAPWLAPTRRLIARALEERVPFLGICLGGQLLAHVAGGTVRAAHGLPEAGSTPLTLRPEAEDDALFHGLPARVTAIEHRVDAVTSLPAGASWLAESERCPIQAFRVGESAWGLQFHPEATSERIAGWDPGVLRRQGFVQAELLRTACRDEPESTRIWREVARRFAGVVGGADAGCGTREGEHG